MGIPKIAVSDAVSVANELAAATAEVAAEGLEASFTRNWSMMCTTPFSRRTSGRTIRALDPLPLLTYNPVWLEVKVKGSPAALMSGPVLLLLPLPLPPPPPPVDGDADADEDVDVDEVVDEVQLEDDDELEENDAAAASSGE